MAKQNAATRISPVTNDLIAPLYAKVVSESRSPALRQTNLYDPLSIDLQRACGGYNSVIEISSTCCLRVFDYSMDLNIPFNISISPDDFANFLNANNFLSSDLNNMKKKAFQQSNFVFYLYPTPVELQLVDSATVIIKYSITIVLTSLGGGISNQNNFSLLTGRSHYSLPPQWQSSFEVVITSDYEVEPDPILARVNITANLATAKLEMVIPSGDAKLIFDQLLASKKKNISNWILSKPKVEICPEIALTGKNVFDLPFDTIANFDVQLFPVTGPGEQALAVAFNLRAGCRGTKEYVQHFIGDNDYGIITDEYLAERVLKYKWRLGGFRRELSLSRSFQGHGEDKNGNVINFSGSLNGTLALDTLDLVSIETDSITRTDYIHIGGAGVILPNNIVFSDGTVINPVNASTYQVPDTYFDAENLPWNLFTTINIDDFTPSSDPQLQLFQKQAHEDAYQYLGRPFSNFTIPPDLCYCRTEGVLKQLFFLGNISRIFH